MNETLQLQREQKMFDLGLERLDRSTRRANEAGYATSGPLLAPTAYGYIERLAETIGQHIQQRRALRTKIIKGKPVIERPRTQGDAAMERMVEMYTGLELTESDLLTEDGVDGSLQVVDGSNIEQPKYGLMLIAAVVWKSLCDRGFKSNHFDGSATPRVRCNVKSEIGRMLYLQHRVKHYRYIREQHLTKETSEELRKLIFNIEQAVGDNESNLAQRLQTAKRRYDELDSGEIYVRRGPKSTGARLILPYKYNHANVYSEWSNLFVENAANEILNLLLIPKDGEYEPNDPRPFLIKSDSATGNDVLIVRDNFKAILEDLRSEMSAYTVDFLPMLVKPKDWIDNGEIGRNNKTGGYFSDEVSQLVPLVRFGSGTCLTKPSQLTLDLLNKAQSVQWQIDEDQLDLVKRLQLDWQTDFDGITVPFPYTEYEIKKALGGAALLPEVQFRAKNAEQFLALKKKLKAKEKFTDLEMAFYQACIDNNRRISDLYRKANKKENACLSYAALITRLERLRGQQFHYVWNADYRTRIYPVAGLGSPQGRPSERYTLEFSKGERLTPDGEIAALRAIGTAVLDSKVSIDDRIAWARDNQQMVHLVGTESNEGLEFANSEADEPLQLVSLCRSWLGHLAGEEWHAPVYADAVNSGWAITAALMNDTGALRATNICRATTADKPSDAYALVRDHVVQRFKDRSIEMKCGTGLLTDDERHILIDLLTQSDGKLGRKISKAYGRTAIYGSGMGSQVRDIRAELAAKDISSNLVSREMGTRLTKEIEAGYKMFLGDGLNYNRQLKKWAAKELYKNIPEEMVKELKELANRRRKQESRNVELRSGEMSRYIQLSREMTLLASEGLTLVSPDGTLIDCTQYLKTTEVLKSEFHGHPRAPITHPDAIDFERTLKAAAPGLIHSIDAYVLKLAYANVPYDINLVHDAVGVHPNHFDDACLAYRKGFLDATSGNVLEDVANAWGCEAGDLVGSDVSWRDEVLEATNMFN